MTSSEKPSDHSDILPSCSALNTRTWPYNKVITSFYYHLYINLAKKPFSSFYYQNFSDTQRMVDQLLQFASFHFRPKEQSYRNSSNKTWTYFEFKFQIGTIDNPIWRIQRCTVGLAISIDAQKKSLEVNFVESTNYKSEFDLSTSALFELRS